MKSTATEYTVLLLLTVAGLPEVNSEPTETTTTTCVSSYEEFEEKTFNKNNPNRYNLYQVFYPQNQHMPYAVDISFKVMLANGQAETVHVDTPPDKPGIPCNITNWRWLASSVFLIARSEYLNKCAYYTVNYFREWRTPRAQIQIPHLCPNVTMEFLALMCSLAHEYAVDSDRERWTPQPLVAMCVKENWRYVPSIRRNSGPSDIDTVSITVIFYLGAVLGIVAALGGAVGWMKQNLQTLSQKTHTYSHSHYGVCWGMTGLLSLVVSGSLYIDIPLLMKLNGDSGQLLPIITIVLYAGVVTLPGLPISLYFAYKTKPPAVPCIVLVPVTLLCCCCNTKRARSFVFWLALWINLMAMEIIVTHSLIILAGMLAEPFATVTNTLVLFLMFFCAANILGLLLTIAAFVSTKKHLRPHGQGRIMLRAALLVPILATIICLCFAVSATGYLINTDANKGSLVSLVTSVTLPLSLAGVTLLLQTLMTKWLKNIANKTDPSHRVRRTTTRLPEEHRKQNRPESSGEADHDSIA